VTEATIPPLCALTSQSTHTQPGDLARIAASLQKQVLRDFAPLWGVTATVQPFGDPSQVPAGYWHMTILDQLDDPGAAGYHTDENGQPLALVEWGGSIEATATTCSHELLETLADPWGSRLVVGTVPGAGRCRVLVEACDPCEAFTYDVDGLPLSDFLCPRYYGPQTPGDPGKLTFCGTVHEPLTIVPGGYLSYIKEDGQWYQTTWFGGTTPSERNLSSLLAELPAQGSLRGAIDRVTFPTFPEEE
jgi:hypothetical protein